jgi:hypothetical protein
LFNPITRGLKVENSIADTDFDFERCIV